MTMNVKQANLLLFDTTTTRSKTMIPHRWCRIRMHVHSILFMVLVWNSARNLRLVSQMMHAHKVDTDPPAPMIRGSAAGAIVPTAAATTKTLPSMSAINGMSSSNHDQASPDQPMRTTATTHIAKEVPFRSCNVSDSKPVQLTNYTKDAIRPNDLSAFMVMDPTPVLWDDADVVTIDASSNTSRPYSTCRLQVFDNNRRLSSHFPHVMQQFYRCWSFWQSYPHHQPLLLTPQEQPSKPWFQHAFHYEFTRELWKLLPDLGIQIVTWKNQTKHQPNTASKEQRQPERRLQHEYQSVSVQPSKGPIFGKEANAFQVASVQHLKSLKEKVLKALNMKPSSETSTSTTALKPSFCSKKGPRIGFINRQKTREVRNAMELVEDLQQELGQNVSLVTFDGKSFREQVELMSQWDILVTPHGAQETSVLFLQECGGVLELMPEKYYYPKFFGTLAAASGLSHAVIHMNTNGTLIQDGEEEFKPQHRDDGTFCPSRQAMRDGVQVLIHQWQMCCDNMRQTES